MIGAGQTDKVALAIRRHIWLAYLCVVPLLLVVAAFPQMFIRIYTDIPQLIDAAVPTVWVMCSAYVVLVPANVLLAACRAQATLEWHSGLRWLRWCSI